MKLPPDGGPAFPCPHPVLPDGGMSLRAYIATAALQGMLADSNVNGTAETLSIGAVIIADALIAELNKPK